MNATHRADEWYSPARFGMFYHWGLYTGGGCSTSAEGRNSPFTHDSVDAFERAAASPEVFARNLVGLTKKVGARYLTLTLFHSCDRHAVLYPTEVPNFLVKTTRDYIGPVIDEARRQGLRLVLYFPAGPHHFNSEGGPFLQGIPDDWKSEEACRIWDDVIRKLFQELCERYGDGIAGLWMDGCMSWQPAKDVFPDAIRIGNNQLQFHLDPPPDVSTTEFLSNDADPPYNRPSGLAKPNLRWGDNHLAPRKDYNEDIPTCNGWWWRGKSAHNEYTKSPTFWVKQMICCLGQRRRWNYAMGLGPMLDGSAPPEFEPMVETMSRFMSWAHPAIYDTMGGEGAPLQQGWLNSGAFGSITVPYDEPNTYYLLVTEPPSRFTSGVLKVQHDWVTVESVADLRTGSPMRFEMNGSLNIANEDWSDIEEYGAKVFRIRLAGGANGVGQS